jgi:predicted HTH transcriptional regulator
MLLTGDIEHFGTGILEMIKRSKETDLIAPEFVINEGFMLILWKPSATAKAILDTIHDTKFIAIENLSHRVVWLLDNEMSRNE